MSKNIQNRLSALQPYVIGVRFQGGVSIVDAVFTKGWTVPKSETILSEKGDAEELNYHMFFTQDEGIGLDEILDYVERVIGLNIEREKKHELLKVKVKELQDVFRSNPLSKLETLKFVLASEKLIKPMEDDPLDVVEFDLEPIAPVAQPKPVAQPQPVAQPKPQPQPQPEVEVRQQPVSEENVRRAPNGEIIPPLEPEDRRELEDEFQTYDLTSKEETITKNVGGKNIDLPKKRKAMVELEEFEEPSNVICKCGPEDVCPACEEAKIGSY
jgi:hypothetical protein